MGPLTVIKAVARVDRTTLQSSCYKSADWNDNRLFRLSGWTADELAKRACRLHQDACIEIVLRALEEPLRQIVSNAGAEPSVVMNKIVEGKGNYGYNAANDTGDMLEMGVIDPTKGLPLLD